MENNSGENKHNNHRHKRHNRPRNNQKERNQNRQLNEEQENITETQAQDIPTNDQLQSQTEGNAMLEDDDPDDIGNISDIEPKKVVKHVTEDDKDHTQAEDWEKYLDIDIRTGLSPESAKIAENIFLTRGLSDTPEPERTHCRQYQYNACKLPTYDWISKLDISLDYTEFPIAEVRFKNSHKDFYLLPQEGVFKVGDIVAVESNPGHDIGIISMLGLQVKRQLEHKRIAPENVTKKLYRTARYADIEEWIATVGLEHETMLKSRYTAWDLNLKMKVNDVEYQGDGTKAIFYYSAEERVDFRELIKILAELFHIRIEMRQIGVRQEAARLGGLGSCGRELCCSSWLTNFQSVSTNTARTQQLSLNPQKLAGMCGKLKCCLNFEQETYQQELKEFPSPSIHLKTKKGKGFYNKIDIFKKIVWYSYADDPSTIFALPLDKVKQIIKMNESGKYPDTLEEFASVNQKKVDEGNNYSMDELKHIADEK
ncbi:MAG: hypothetical protein IJQ94_00910 [Bacteroidales bacterium]|nr:hypothetical protein [Bacteroidales bacterium]